MISYYFNRLVVVLALFAFALSSGCGDSKPKNVDDDPKGDALEEPLIDTGDSDGEE